jgi:hypothetical protein
MKVNLSNKVWSYATAFVVFLIILNPELIEIALFIDAIGLEMFLMLFEVQVMVLLAALLNNIIKPIFNYLKYCIKKHQLLIPMMSIKVRLRYILLVADIKAAIMHILVVYAAVGAVLNV